MLYTLDFGEEEDNINEEKFEEIPLEFLSSQQLSQLKQIFMSIIGKKNLKEINFHKINELGYNLYFFLKFF